MNTNPYYDDRGNPLLEESFCLYLDILGFSKQINDACDGDTEHALFNRIYPIIQEVMREFSFDDPEGKSAKDMWAYKFFTDNFILGLPKNTGVHSEAQYGALLFPVLRSQLYLASQGYFVRGALTIGPLHVSENIVFGKSLLDAYGLESNKAITPRIILSANMLALIRQHATDFYSNPAESPQNADIFLDSDGQAFLNYLGAAIEEESGEYVANWNLIRQHKDHIEACLKKFRTDPTIWAKYNWVANYHNFFCEEARHLSGYDKSLKVSSPNHKNSPSRLFQRLREK